MTLIRRVLRTVCALAFIAAIGAHSAEPERSADERSMVGTWYGEFLPSMGAPLQRFITTRMADGTFTLHARIYQGDKAIADARNAGLWGVSNGIYFTVTTEVNGVR